MILSNYRFLLVCLTMTCFMSWSSSEVYAASPYSAAVSLEEDTTEQREAAFKDALALVLVKVTGQRNIAQEAAVVDIIDGAAGFVQGFRFEREDDEQMMRVNFDGRAVEKAVAERGLPVWGSERPAVLLWLAVDDRRGNRFVLAADDHDTKDTAARLRKTIARLADSRGLPVTLPLYDAQDQDAVSFADLWGGFDEAVNVASERYAPDAILVGRARTRGRTWEVRWNLMDINGRQQWVGGFADGINQTADTYAQAFAVLRAEGEVILIVDDVSSFDAYGQVLSHLRGLSVVEQVDLNQATDSTLTFRLRLRGDTDVLQRAIRLGGRLQAVSQEIPTMTMGPLALRYQYRP